MSCKRRSDLDAVADYATGPAEAAEFHLSEAVALRRPRRCRSADALAGYYHGPEGSADWALGKLVEARQADGIGCGPGLRC